MNIMTGSQHKSLPHLVLILLATVLYLGAELQKGREVSHQPW